MDHLGDILGKAVVYSMRATGRYLGLARRLTHIPNR